MGQLNVRNLPEVHFQQMAAEGVQSDHVFAGVCRVRMPLAYVRDTDLILIDCPAGKLELLIPSGAGEAVGIPTRDESAEISSEPLEDLLPSIDSSHRPIIRPIHREEGVPGIVVGMEFVGLSPLLEFRLGLRHMLGRGTLILPPEQSQQGTAQVLRVVERVHGLARGKPLRTRPYTAAVAVDRGVDPLERARGQVDLPAPGAVADEAHLAVEIGQGAEIPDGAVNVSHGAVVRHAAGGPHAGAVLLRCTLALSEMQVWRDGHIAAMGELAGDLLGRFVPAGHVMDHHNPRPEAGSCGAREVRIDHVSLVAAHIHDLRTHGLRSRPLGGLRGLRLRL